MKRLMRVIGAHDEEAPRPSHLIGDRAGRGEEGSSGGAGHQKGDGDRGASHMIRREAAPHFSQRPGAGRAMGDSFNKIY